MFKVLVLMLFIINSLNSSILEFDHYKKDGIAGHRLLVIGGIHGNEPGGYFAASFLAKYYDIIQGSLWVVPNLNFDSIVRNSRGIYKDMNRKFSSIDKDDPDYKIVTKIKAIIKDKSIDLVLNLHDGYGFYRSKYQNNIFNPNAWGQTTIIDQKKIDGLKKFGNLDEIAKMVNINLNQNLQKTHHSFGVKNTKTKFTDEQMQLSLTYFAVTHNKPAFAIETSKNIVDLTRKVIYQLRAIEEFMNVMGIKYKRNFDIDSYQDVKKLLFDFGVLTINNNFTIDLNNVRKNTRFVPLDKYNRFDFTHDLGAVVKSKESYNVYIGNRLVTKLNIDKFKISKQIRSFNIEIDSKIKSIQVSDLISVHDSFVVRADDKYRVNIIGFSNKNGKKNENNIVIKKHDIASYYSLDKNSKVFRVEFYDGDKFCGMIRVKFIN